jgi:hypothetical protein
MRSKRRLGQLDERVEANAQSLGIQYDNNDLALSKLKYRQAEVKEDYNALANRQRHRGSLG